MQKIQVTKSKKFRATKQMDLKQKMEMQMFRLVNLFKKLDIENFGQTFKNHLIGKYITGRHEVTVLSKYTRLLL